MAVYNGNSSSIQLQEQDIYGSSRIGMVNNPVAQTGTQNPQYLDKLGNGYLSTFSRGKKLFELSNHLGNVQVTLSDKVQMVATPTTVDPGGPGGPGGPTGDVSDVYVKNAVVVTANDYYPFGMTMPGRSATMSSSNGDYRYGFNGKEKDADMDGNNYDYGSRIYNPNIGTWLSVDALQRKHPDASPYSYTGNNPVNRIDPDGRDDIHFHFLTIRTLVPDPQKGSRIVFKNVSWVTVVPNNNPDRFLVHSQTLDNDDIRSTKGTPTDKVSELRPFGNSVFSYKDYNKVAELATSNSALMSYLEKHDSKYKSLRTADAANKVGDGMRGAVGGILIIEESGYSLYKLSTARNLLSGSGPGSGIIEVSSRVKSTAAFENTITVNAKDFVFDAKNNTFVVAGDNFKLGHTGLVRAIGADDANVVGGRIKLNANGNIETSQWSGHYGTNWTNEISEKFKEFMKNQTNKDIEHSGSQYFKDGSK